MKLGSKIILGFILANAVYLILMAFIFVFIQPVKTKSNHLIRYVITAYEQANNVRYLVAEQTSILRAYTASPSNDRAIFERFAQINRETFDEIASLDRVLSSPEAAFLRTPAIASANQRIADSFKAYTEMAMTTPDRQDKIFRLRDEFMDAYDVADKALTEALKVENSTIGEAINAGYDIGQLTRRIEALNMAMNNLNESCVFFIRGLLRHSQELFDRSQALAVQAERSLAELAAESKSQVVRASLEKTRQTLREEYQSHMKGTLALIYEDREATERRLASADTVLSEAENLTSAVKAITLDFAEDMLRAIVKIVTVMTIGAVLAIAVSLIFAVLITRSIVGAINNLIESLSECAQEVDGASGQLSGSSNSLAQGATESAASLEETSAALEELSSMTRRNADNAVEASGLTAKAAEAIIQAEKSMTDVIRAMEEISRSGNEIGKIIKTIDEIAFQTNLLALNAAVEAARAGEAGAGFAVVADEVRNLAIRSAEAAKNTADLIADTIANINSGSDMVNATAENFRTVDANAGKVAELVSEVAEASKEQSQGIAQITQAMSEMDKVTQANAASSEQAASAASQLSLQAGSLLSAVEEMKALTYGRETHGLQGGDRFAAPPASPAPPAPRDREKSPAAGRKALAVPDDNFSDF
ncbi:MAG: methyl-accepting chemotaxis protein [Deltaproteobacteria bacterium]|nr:methyl-accepting chemotaxis protein [Deltaproteobacteria bacterium]